MDVHSVTRTALCIGHPGHELRVLEWVRRNRPLTDVLTDGSGPNRPSRFHLSAQVLTEAGARLGGMRGDFPDRQFYAMILRRDPGPFIGLAQRLVDEWIAEKIETVAGDMIEGFSPTHDLCRMIINAACERIERVTGRRLLNLEFAVETSRPPKEHPQASVVSMDEAQFARKLEAATMAYPDLVHEVNRLIAAHGERAFRLEYLAPADPAAGLIWDGSEPPYYEAYGRRRIGEGHYHDLITFTGHIQPLAQALHEWGRRAS
jgi:hypothetical protein